MKTINHGGVTFDINEDVNAPSNGANKGRYVCVENGIPYVFYDFDNMVVKFTGCSCEFHNEWKSMGDFLSCKPYMKNPINFFKKEK